MVWAAGSGWDDSTRVMRLSPGACCGLGSSTVLRVASPSARNPRPDLVFPRGVSVAGYSDYLKEEAEAASFLTGNIFWAGSASESSPKTFINLYKIPFFNISVNLGLEIPLAVTCDILCNLALTSKESEFLFRIPGKCSGTISQR